jgi:peptidoglycan hydrolase-like protein with peptidoglycan-binding domain
MKGGDVKTLQRLLTQAGFPTEVSGTFTGATKSSVIQFERQYRLTANGAVNKKDVNELNHVVVLMSTDSTSTGPSGGAGLLNATDGTTTTTNSPTLKQGSTGKWVSLLQEDLTFAGYQTDVDGQFGPETTQTVDQFKQAKGLAPNGVFKQEAWRYLRSAVKAAEASVPAGSKARLNPDGLVTAPADAPTVIKEVIAAANKIATRPYVYGGGHASFTSYGYDCSGSVGFALHGGGLLSVTEDSGEMESYGLPGVGKWITMYANGGHVYAKIAGIWFDTAAQSPANGNDRWSTTRIDPAAGYVVRHPVGY